MPDHFAILDQPRRPWLDPEALKERFHRASATWHPDVAGTGDAARFAAASAAYNALLEPVTRLRHLLELEAPGQAESGSTVPPDFADLFMRLAEFRQAFNVFEKKESAATQGLARALLIEEREALWLRVNHLQAQLQVAYDASLALLRELDAGWEARPPDAAGRVAALQQRFAYLSKWRAQVGECLFKLQTA